MCLLMTLIVLGIIQIVISNCPVPKALKKQRSGENEEYSLECFFCDTIVQGVIESSENW